MRIAALLALVLLSGCAATRAVPPSAYADTQARLDGKRVTVVLADGTAWPADALRLAPDSTSWFDARSGEIVIGPTAQIVRIDHRNLAGAAGRGATRGLIVSAVIGVGLGAFLASYEITGGIAVATTLWVAVFGTAAGAAAGAGGSLVGVRDRYTFPPPDPPRGSGAVR